MKIAYLIDKDSLGGGCEYIRRKIGEARTKDGGRGVSCRTFFSDRGECRAMAIDAWGADEIVVNHLKALLQLLGRPWERPRGKVRMIVHGIHLRKYSWRARELRQQGRVVSQAVPLLCYALRRALEAWLYHRCEEIVALTEGDRADILRLYGKDLQVVVESNTLAGWTPQMAGTTPELWSRLTQSRPEAGDRPRYVFIGNFDYQKGQDRWIRFLAAHPSTTGGTLFIGDGSTLESCRKLAADLGVGDRCFFAGAIPNADRCLTCGDTVVSASRWEGMPYLLMKARALGCRILATDCPGNREVLAGYGKWECLQP